MDGSAFGENDIEDDGVGVVLPRQFHRLIASRGFEDTHPLHQERAAKQLKQGRLVIDDQDGFDFFARGPGIRTYDIEQSGPHGNWALRSIGERTESRPAVSVQGHDREGNAG